MKVIIPARYASSRLPGKPLLKILGKPIISHVVDRVAESGISRKNIYVATDHNEIVQVLEEYKIQYQLTSELHESGSDRVNEVVVNLGCDPDEIILNVQGDEPLINPALIRELVDFIKNKPSYDIWTTIVPIVDFEEFQNPNVVKTILGPNHNALYFTRAPAPVERDDPGSFKHAFRHIGLYAYKASSLLKFCSYEKSTLENTEKLEQLRALSNGMSIGLVQFDGDVSHGVDTIEDFYNIRAIMESQ
jgi:3-deoxy-manno-octulosonate cytidylyltransferase (CMP-KDO synthetase)